MKRVVITGVGFTLPHGVGSSREELSLDANLTPTQIELSGGETLFHYDIPELQDHPLYPGRKVTRHMRTDAIYAYIAALLAMDDAGLSDADHQETLYYTSTGQCYGDMAPFIKVGLEASQVDGIFDLQKFGEQGHTRVNPFFSIRTLGALPMAMVANKLSIHGENYVSESFGAESVAPMAEAFRDIQNGKSSLAVVGAQDFLQFINEMDNIYFNGFYKGDFYGSSSATTLILEEYEMNRARGGKCYGELLQCEQVHYPIGESNKIEFPEKPFAKIVDTIKHPIYQVHLTAVGTKERHAEGATAVKELFPETKTIDYFDRVGDLLAGSEPFGTLMHLLTGEGIGLSLSRSVCGVEGAIVVDRSCANV